MFNPDDEDIVELVRAAVQAPSADNRHHIRFHVDGAGIEIWSDSRFDGSAARHQRMLHLLSVGAVVENLRLALTQVGWTFEPRWLPRPAAPRCLVDLRWGALEAAPGVDPLASQLFTRHTNRRLLKGPRATESERRALDDAVRSVEGIHLHWFDEGHPRRSLLRMMRRAEAARFRIPRLHAELFESIVFEAGWSGVVDEGLAPATLEVETLLRKPFAALRHRPVMTVASWLGAHHLLGFRAATIPAALAPHRVVLTSEGPAERFELQGGVALERFWLTADRLGLEIQPMVAAAVLATLDGQDARERRLAAYLAGEWKALIGDRTALVVLRVGHAARPRMVSRRRPAAHYVDRSSPTA